MSFDNAKGMRVLSGRAMESTSSQLARRPAKLFGRSRGFFRGGLPGRMKAGALFVEFVCRPASFTVLRVARPPIPPAFRGRSRVFAGPCAAGCRASHWRHRIEGMWRPRSPGRGQGWPAGELDVFVYEVGTVRRTELRLEVCAGVCEETTGMKNLILPLLAELASLKFRGRVFTRRRYRNRCRRWAGDLSGDDCSESPPGRTCQRDSACGGRSGADYGCASSRARERLCGASERQPFPAGGGIVNQGGPPAAECGVGTLSPGDGERLAGSAPATDTPLGEFDCSY